MRRLLTARTAVKRLSMGRRGSSAKMTEREEKDAEVVFKQARELLSAFPGVPPDYAETWLRNEYQTDPMLQQDWDSHYQSEDHMRQSQRRVERTLTKFRARVEKTTVDPQATKNRASGTAAVCSASNSAQRERPVDFGKMSDADFNEHSKKNFGFDPQL